jgi:phospholipid/cholesterol/gamma-HCH transport system permease protein
MPETKHAALLEVRRAAPDIVLVVLSGNWRTRPGMPRVDEVDQEISRVRPSTMKFDTRALGDWDSGLLSFLLRCAEICERSEVRFDRESLPPGLRKLIQLAQAVPNAREAGRDPAPGPLLSRLGSRTLRIQAGVRAAITFVGEVALAGFNLLRGRAQFRWSDTWLAMQESGPEALGVVALINFLVGLILAFAGAVLLPRFGADIFVPDLVAMATVREMGCLMTGIILCGRTGAAFAAQLGAMKGNEEIDALRTFGMSPVEFLVLPRVLALVLMMPLLTVFANLIAITGAFVVSVSMLDMTPALYIERTLQAIQLKSFVLGVVKGGAFGLLVAVTGCLRGMQADQSAAGVGRATTSAVVTGITSIVAADGLFAVICDALKI